MTMPLTQGQLGIWMAQMLDPADPCYNIGECVEIEGAVDPLRFERALRDAVAATDAMHLRFMETETGPVQYFQHEPNWELVHLDFSSHANPEQAAYAWMQQDMSRPFRLSGEMLYRFALLRISPTRHFWYAVNHHIINDGAGWRILLRRTSNIYTALAGWDPGSAVSCGSWRDLISDELSYRNSAHYQRDRAFWLKTLAGHTAPVTVSGRPLKRPAGFLKITGYIPHSLDLVVLAQRHAVSPAAVMVAATAIYLHRMTGAEQMLIGMPVAARIGSRSRSIVGPAVNSVPLRVSISASDKIGEVIARIARNMRDAMRHQRYSGGDIRRDLGLRPGEPDICGAYVNFIPFEQDIDFGGHPILRNPLGNWHVEDLHIVYFGGTHPAGQRVDLVANAEHYTEEDLARHCRRFFSVVQQLAAADANAPARSIAILTPGERHTILQCWNETEADYQADKCIHELFEAQAEKTPDAVAVEFEGRRLSYGELNARANRLAHHLRRLGVKPDGRVAICVDRGFEMIAGLLAVLKAGGAYVPLDPAYPANRLAFMLADSAPVAVLTESAGKAALAGHHIAAQVIDLGDAAQWAGESDANLDCAAIGLGPRNLAYVIYTSGSTGAPKGVMVEHRQLCGQISSMRSPYGLSEKDRVLQFASVTFDISIEEIFGALLSGAALILRTQAWVAEPAEFWASCGKHAISVVSLPTQFWLTLVQPNDTAIPACLRLIIIGGDAVTEAGLKAWLSRDGYRPRLFNTYGPTETTVNATLNEMKANGGRDYRSIGRPISNTRIYILDPHGEPLPIGVTGELYIGGVGVARGYLNRPELTAERFLPDPFSGAPDARMYRTGDLGRWLPDGNIEFLGRNDHQVKIRGFRIELGEIEARLEKHPGVRQAVVLAREDSPGEKRLVAYYAGEDGIGAEDLRAHLSKALPEYMVPAAYVRLDVLPVTPNGKLDRRALSEKAHTIAGIGEPSDAPLRTPTELALGEIWRDVLRCATLGRTDDFFALGGDSLRAIQVITRVQRMFNIDLPLSATFDARTLEALAKRIDTAARGANGSRPVPAVIPQATGSTAPLSFSQQRMWVIQSLDPQNTAYNMSSALLLTGSLDVDALSWAMDEVLSRHDILRTVYPFVDGRVMQQVQCSLNNALEYIDLTAVAADSKVKALELAAEMASTPIDLANGPVFTRKLIRTAPDEHVLLFTMHHIAGDQWSAGVIGRELAILYNARCAGQSVELPKPAVRYRDFASWQRSLFDSAELTEQLRFWRRTLADVPPLNLPADRPRPRVPTLNGSYVQSDIPESLFVQLEQLGRREAATLFMTLFAGFAVTLSRLSGQIDISAGVPVANRSEAVEQVVGTFVNLLALRVDLSGDPTFSELLGRVRATALGAFANQDVPFDKLVQELVQSRDTSRAPLVQVLFNVLNAPMHGIEFNGLKWQPLAVGRRGAQFELSVSVDRQITRTLSVEYNTDLYDKGTIERFINRYILVVSRAAAAPHTRLSEFDLLLEDERHKMLRAWNATATDAPARPFIRMFEDRAAERPNAPALTFEDVTLSYGALNARANALACELAQAGLSRAMPVGICMERSVAMLVALLAVQKSGGTYVPLDPALPANRLQYMVADSGLNVVILGGDAARSIEFPPDTIKIDAEKYSDACVTTGAVNPANNVLLSDAAYIIYTSGSTGRPKGVAISHAALANFLCSMQRSPGISERDVLAAVTTISFDISGLELYLPLLAGARVELVPHATASDGKALSELLLSKGVTVMQATPATWRILIDAGWLGCENFRALSGGETLSRELADVLLDRCGELWNLYGPTETTIWSTAGRVDRGNSPISIGRPIDNTQVYILNGLLPAPFGVAGEICIGGAGVGIGYHGQPGWTAERFVKDPFSDRAGARLYRTGDLGRWDAKGELYHLGRMDHQVKIRGFRVETGEIESALCDHPAVRQAVVVAREIGPGDVRLVAYIVYQRAGGLTISEVRRFLQARLPEYMVPAIAVALDAIPLTANGKLDRSLLPDPFAHASRPANGFEAPTPGAEAAIAGVWSELLNIGEVGAEDNFFDLGGDSLLALRFVAHIERQTGMRIDPRNLFFQNLRQIAARIPELQAPRDKVSPL
jgi:amino acid adenylation domain-containing protein